MKLFKVMETAYTSFDNTVRTYLAKTFNNLGMQYTHSQIFGVIFDGIKGVMQNIMFYIEDAMTEQNVFNATRKQSVYSLAKISGFDAYYGSSSSGILIGKLMVNNGLASKTSKVYIQNHSKVINRNSGVSYSIVLPTSYYVFDVTKPLITHEFLVVQGTFLKATYVSKGNYLEIVHVKTPSLFDKQYVSVTVDGEKYNIVSCLYDMTHDSKECVISVGYDNTFDIMFGNGLYGKKLEEGQSIIIEYLSHSGTFGNILPTESTDFVFETLGYDSIGNSVDINNFMNLSMNTCISGGTNSDSIDFIRNMIGYNSRSLVLASADNFKLFFKRFSFIGYVNCWSETNSMVVIATCLKDIKPLIKEHEDYYKIDSKDLLLDNDQKTMICNTLENSKRAFAGISLEFKDPIIRKFAFICYVKVSNVYERDTVKMEIRKFLAQYFMELETETQFIAKSDIMKFLLDNITNIESLDIDIMSELGEQTYFNGYYDKNELKFINGIYEYRSIRTIYESQRYPGIDSYGNISLDSKLEVAMLHGGFKYYTDKESGNKNDFVLVDDVQIFFI